MPLAGEVALEAMSHVNPHVLSPLAVVQPIEDDRWLRNQDGP